ncbi:MAG: XRE family transcriptional regulator [Microgenomates group bacterium Gr01-1014_5]|nr:MAG: XRE family transcriptional regulator [Microgenomates group bacterium Gr01-1014_5]
MRSAGTVLKEAREAKKKTLSQVSRKTRIKEKFLSALEDSDWGNLPNFTVAQGFARVYAQNVEANPSLVAALLRRDFPQNQGASYTREIALYPSSLWTPKTTIFATIILSLVFLGFYLGRQYFQFSAPPPLSVSVSDSGVIGVSGKTSPSATVEVNGRPILVESDGSFKAEVERQDLINSAVYVEATSRTGKKSTVSKPIE